MEIKSDAAAASYSNSIALSTDIAGDMNRMVDVAKAATFVPYADTPVLVTIRSFRIAVLDATKDRAYYTTVQIAKGLVMVTPKNPFHVILTNLQEAPLHILKRMIVAQVASSLASIIATEAALQKPGPETIVSVLYNSTMDRNT